jgi:ribonuclease P protein component
VALARVDPAAPARLGLAVRAETAVTRNRARRRVRAAWATQTPQGWDVVVKGSGSLATLNFQDLEGHLAKALSQAGAA